MTALGPARRIVVVGGGIAGVSTCGALRADGYGGEIVLVDGGDVPYDRPPLSKGYLSGDKNDDAIALQSPEWFAKNAIELVARTRALGLAPDALTIKTDTGQEISGDRIILATGGRAARPPIPGAEDSRVHVLRDVEDARRLRKAIQSGARAVIVGAGLIGSEVASTLIDVGMHVTLVDPVEVPLARVVGPELGTWMRTLHEQRGVELRTAGVEKIISGPAGLDVVLTGQQRAVQADLVVMGVGMVPADELGRAGGLDTSGGILVDAHQQTSRPGIFAVGDVARERDGSGGALPRVEHWEAARHDAARVSAHLTGKEQPETTAPWFWSDQHGRHIEVVGSLAGAGPYIWRGERDDARFSVFAVSDGLVTGAFAVDDAMVVRAARRLIDRRIDADPAQLADVTVNARKLVKG